MAPIKFGLSIIVIKGAPKGGGAAAPKSPQTEIKKKTDFVDLVISNVVRDFPNGWNQPLKSTDN